jgi:type II secretory pathway pseudopilin PulG
MKAYTILELLVVTAILAALAAILFPAFAQAKASAKKSFTTSNVRTELTAIAMYASDMDGTYPMGFGARPDGIGTWGSGVIHPVPYNVVTTSPWTYPQRWTMAACFWANAVSPYTKSLAPLAVPGDIPTSNSLGPGVPDTFLYGVTPALVGLTYNGLLHTLSEDGVRSPAQAVMMWEDQNVNYMGRALSSPVKNCSALGPGPDALQADVPPCQFESGDSGGINNQSTGVLYVYDMTHSVWIFGNRMVYGYCDTHAKLGFVGLALAPAMGAPSSSVSDPYAQVGENGTAFSYWPCGEGGPNDFGPTAVYPCFFRPDRNW